jgi:hypothetical protein
LRVVILGLKSASIKGYWLTSTPFIGKVLASHKDKFHNLGNSLYSFKYLAIPLLLISNSFNSFNAEIFLTPDPSISFILKQDPIFKTFNLVIVNKDFGKTEPLTVLDKPKASSVKLGIFLKKSNGISSGIPAFRMDNVANSGNSKIGNFANLFT